MVKATILGKSADAVALKTRERVKNTPGRWWMKYQYFILVVYGLFAWSPLTVHAAAAEATLGQAAAAVAEAPNSAAGDNGSLRFNGSNDVVRVAKPLPLGETFTLAGWVNRTVSNLDQEVIATLNDPADGRRLYAVVIDGHGDLCGSPEGQYVFLIGEGGENPPLCSHVVAELGRWHHVAITQVNPHDHRLLIDGRLTVSDSRSAVVHAGAATLSFGSAEGFGDAFGGLLHGMSLTARPLLIDFVPERQPLTVTPETIALWSFGDGAGRMVKDRTGHGYDGLVSVRKGRPSPGSDEPGPKWSSDTPSRTWDTLP